jgi:hypothetical protein
MPGVFGIRPAVVEYESGRKRHEIKRRGDNDMAIQKKSLVSTLKTAKKAKVASKPLAEVESGTNEKKPVRLMGKSFARRNGARFARIN